MDQSPIAPEYSVDIDQARQRFADAGIPRSNETIARYCRKGGLQGVKIDTDLNEKWLITPESIDTKITELKSVVITRHNPKEHVVTGNSTIQQDRPSNDERLTDYKDKLINTLLERQELDKDRLERLVERAARAENEVVHLGNELQKYKQIESPKNL